MLLPYMRRAHHAYGRKALSSTQCSGCGCRERVEIPTQEKKSLRTVSQTYQRRRRNEGIMS